MEELSEAHPALAWELEGPGAELGAPAEAARPRPPFSEADEVDLASALLEVTSEEELDRFLVDVLRRAGRSVAPFLSTSTGRAVGSLLKGAVRKILPLVSHALGTGVGLGPARPGTSRAMGAGRLLGLELEGLSPEDQEFEVARRFVRFAGDAAVRAAAAQRRLEPRRAATAGIVRAARQLAPGLLGSASASCGCGARSPR